MCRYWKPYIHTYATALVRSYGMPLLSAVLRSAGARQPSDSDEQPDHPSKPTIRSPDNFLTTIRLGSWGVPSCLLALRCQGNTASARGRLSGKDTFSPEQ